MLSIEGCTAAKAKALIKVEPPIGLTASCLSEDVPSSGMLYESTQYTIRVTFIPKTNTVVRAEGQCSHPTTGAGMVNYTQSVTVADNENGYIEIQITTPPYNKLNKTTFNCKLYDSDGLSTSWITNTWYTRQRS